MVKQGTRVLVTGGAGFLGSHVTRALCAAGCQVRVLDDLSTGKRHRIVGLGPSVELLHADVRNPATVRRAARGAPRWCTWRAPRNPIRCARKR
jgi:UDP-glucose 4-epimerase